MAFPDPSLSAPALTPWALSYNGVAFGGIVPGSAYQLQSLNGIDLPAYLTADQQRALDQGEFAGIDLSPGRDITIVQAIKADGVSFDHARQVLGGALGVAGASEAPLYLQLPSGTFACLARPRKHNYTIDITAVLAGAVVATTLLHATDPRWYAAPSRSQTVGLPAAAGGGLAIPAAAPWSLGAGGVGGLLNVVNAGRFECRPRLVFTGPCTNPQATNLSIPGAPSIGFAVALNAGDTLTVDTDRQTVVLVTAGSTAGSSRQNTELDANTWWNLPPGVSQVEFNSSDGAAVAGTLTVQSADAYLAL